jgi:hypothetical protein
MKTLLATASLLALLVPASARAELSGSYICHNNVQVKLTIGSSTVTLLNLQTHKSWDFPIVENEDDHVSFTDNDGHLRAIVFVRSPVAKTWGVVRYLPADGHGNWMMDCNRG